MKFKVANQEWREKWRSGSGSGRVRRGGVIVIMAVFLVDVNWYQKFSMFN